MLIGIDPGKKGAIALLDPAEHLVTTFDMPDTIEGKRKLLSDLGKVKAAWIERPFYPRMIGIKNAVTIALHFAEMRTCLYYAGIPAVEVDPSTWKRSLRLSSDKSASRALASQLFPDCADQWALIKHDGRAEAALIAYYGWRKE